LGIEDEHLIEGFQEGKGVVYRLILEDEESVSQLIKEESGWSMGGVIRSVEVNGLARQSYIMKTELMDAFGQF